MFQALIPLALAALSQDPGDPLAVAFVGAADAARTDAFIEFLDESFGDSRFIPRSAVTPESLEGIDVVVLDWQQSDPTEVNPLGRRDDWTLPTVLIGSAGLNAAKTWDVRGGSG